MDGPRHRAVAPPLDAKHAVIVIGVQGGGLDLRPSEANAT
jgi:hypothetical protein